MSFTADLKALQMHDRAGNGVLFAGQYSLEFTNGVHETVTEHMHVVLQGGAKVLMVDRFRSRKSKALP